MRVAVTHYPPGQDEVTVWFDMPCIPRLRDSIHFNDRGWEVAYISWVPDSVEPVTPADTEWHVEVSVR